MSEADISSEGTLAGEGLLAGAGLLPAGPSAVAADAAYRVLARKYRPSNFDDLIGQDAMVRTLTNAFALGRIHQAYLLTGVRGVGKTTTARILARALNYHQPASGSDPLIDAPTVAMGGLGTHCQAIIDSRHVDVIEMDAASHTGIDDIREIIDSARYRPVLARHKVYIIDEVHMLSKAAFNGLLKTLEEPPAHVKFLFATTEADKVPVTVRSRCQRFDLRRIDGPLLVAHLASICAREGVAADEEALALVARAAEGSVRDALSLLDQAIAQGGAHIEADTIRTMLGLADRGLVMDLFEQATGGNIAAALTGMAALYEAGADPLGVIATLADFVHLVTRLKLVPEAAKDSSITGEERRRGLQFAERLSVPVLTRAWQMLTKGLDEVRNAPRPLAAADMVLVRIAYAADLPTPDEALRRLSTMPAPSAVPALPPVSPSGNGAGGSSPGGAAMAVGRMVAGAGAAALRSAPMGAAQARPEAKGPLPQTLDDVLALAQSNRDILLQTGIERDIRLVRLDAGHIEFEPAPGASPQLAGQLTKRLSEWTGIRWTVAVAATGGAPTMRERKLEAAEARKREIATHPVVAKVLELFPGSEIIETQPEPAPVEEPEPPEPPPPAPFDDDVGFAEEIGPDDRDADDL